MKILSLSLLTLCALFAFTPVPPVSGGYDIGDAVEDFTLKNVDDKMHAMSDLVGGKGAIVVFTCNTCPYAVAYEQRIIDLDAKYRPMGYPVVAINPNDVKRKPGDSFEKMKELSERRGYTFPYLHDETQEIAKAFGATRTPHIYLLKREKDDMRVAFIGAIDDNADDANAVDEHFLANAIASIEAGNKPEPAKVKAVGCTIKWRAEQ